MISDSLSLSLVNNRTAIIYAELEKHNNELDHAFLELSVDGKLIARSTMLSENWVAELIDKDTAVIRALQGLKFPQKFAFKVEHFLQQIISKADAELSSSTILDAGKIRLVIETFDSRYLKLASNYYNQIHDAAEITEEFVLDLCRKMAKGRKTEYVVKKFYSDADIVNDEPLEVTRILV